MTQELRGFLTVEIIKDNSLRKFGINGSDVKNIKIITRLFENKHFVILKYGRNVIDAKDVFNKLNCRYNLGETWFISFKNQDVYSLSFRLFNWINYRNMLFEPGIDRMFKEECLKNRHGFIIIPDDYTTELHFKTPCSLKTNAMNQALKSNLCRLLFNKDKI